MQTLRLYTNDHGSIEQAARIIRAGGLVAFPTETVYGLGANALDQAAVRKIFAAKERPLWDPLIVHVSSREMQIVELCGQMPGHRFALGAAIGNPLAWINRCATECAGKRTAMVFRPAVTTSAWLPIGLEKDG